MSARAHVPRELRRACEARDAELVRARQRIADAQRRIITAVRDKNADEARKWMSKHVRDYQRGYELAGISPDTPISV